MHVRLLLGSLAMIAMAAGCSSSSSGSKEPRYTIIKPEDRPTQTGGIPPDKEAEIKLVLQQREPSVRKCYQDVLNEKADRKFAGTVRVVIAIQPSGQASSVRVVGGTLNDEAVRSCLVETIKDFEFPALGQSGEVQYEYGFRPAY